MKTSVIEVHDMLSVFSVEEVEKRIGDVPGVESVTVNHAGGNATVRFDEARLEIADIKSTVRQRGYESGATDAGSATKGHEGHVTPPTAAAPSAPKPTEPSAVAPKPAEPSSVAPKTAEPPAAAPKTAALAAAGGTKPDKAMPSATDKEPSKSK